MKGTTTMRDVLFGAVAVAATAFLAGCSTEAYCFRDCTEDDGIKGGGGGVNVTAGHGGGVSLGGGSGGHGGGISIGGGAGGAGSCVPTNGGHEICDGIDNDCNGTVDDGISMSDPHTCGTCSNNCYSAFANVDPTSVTCTPVGAGKPGTCAFSKCAQDWFDFDKDPTNGCEAACVKTGTSDATCDNRDDDCNGVVDDGVDKCKDANNCGQCGNKCVVANGVGACVQDDGATGACTEANTRCAIGSCADGFVDLDHSAATGCEYACTKTGPEICGDGLDNDCDGEIDGADDDLSGDPALNQPCTGSPTGVCADDAHKGTTTCEGNQVVCKGDAVIHPGDIPETCNGLDDDCNGVADDAPTDAGGACGTSNNLPCRLGTKQCVMGMLTCVGAIDPTAEICNGLDDDCNGAIDDATTDAVGECNAPPDPPPGVPSGCQAGTKKCVGGVVTCDGAKFSTQPNDACGVDSNCDGVLTGQPDLQTDPNNCGGCGKSCAVPGSHAAFACTGGTCEFHGCQPGYVDKKGDHSCDYACTVVSQKEACNGLDDNCDGRVDEPENLTAPSTAQLCGVSPAATSAECTTGVSVTCDAGKWACHFPTGVCSPSCEATAEVCDDLDNNCNGLLNENVPTFGKPCQSDDGKAPPGDGACRQAGTFVCDGKTKVKCSATKADCSTLPGGCTEICDGIDNDCDGLVDEPYSNKGGNPTYFVKPAVTKIATSTWMASYEATRPSADATQAGQGNGYWTSAPTGVTLDKTPACSVPGHVPWFNVTGTEAEQTCAAAGGRLCATGEWQTACMTKPPGATTCAWGYAPEGSACTSGAVAGTKFCNLAATFDASTAAGEQTELLSTGSALLKNCYADWTALLGNGATSGKIFDITGNLRELTKVGTNSYALMGGSFLSDNEAGATCGFDFYQVDQTFDLYDTGFRCCFGVNPDL